MFVKSGIIAMAAVTSMVTMIACSKNDDGPAPVNATVIASSGELATLNASINQFRSIFGDPTLPANGTPGAVGGRREVNWEGVPAVDNHNNNFPLDFFGKFDATSADGRKRGLLMLGPVNPTNFRIDSTNFVEINPNYGTQFAAFSGKRTFVYLGTATSEAVFKVPGTNTDATIKGFGVVFSDVDKANTTGIEYFNGDRSLGKFFAPVRSGTSSFSFLGVHFPNEKVTRVKITCGDGILGNGVNDIGTNNSTTDLVIMDDFFYDEPVAK